MAERAESSDYSVDYSSDIKDAEDERNMRQEIERTEYSDGILPYRFQPECSSEEENEESSDPNNSEDADESTRMEGLSWLEFFIK